MKPAPQAASPDATLPVLIVGAGLAGGWLAHELERLGHPPWLVDRRLPGASSPVAAGLFHPAPGARWNPRAQHAEQLNHARSRYRSLETPGEVGIFHELPLRRLLDSAAARQRWQLQQHQAQLRAWVQSADDHAVTFSGSGWVNVPAALAALGAPARAQGRWLDAVVEDAEFDLSEPQQIRWRGRPWAAVVLCRGWREIHGLGGQDLPWRPARGEILQWRQPGTGPPHPATAPVAGEAPPAAILLSAHGWRIPVSPHHWRAGATHAWQGLPLGPRRAGVRQILAGLTAEGWQPTDLHAVAGVRPIQRADRILAEPCPAHPCLWRFNSLGSHGTLQAPWAARDLAQRLVAFLKP